MLPVLRLLWIRDPVQSRVVHGSLAAAAPEPPAVHAPAQAHHHPELQRGRLRRAGPPPRRRLAAALVPRRCSRPHGGQRRPPRHQHPRPHQQARSVRTPRPCEAAPTGYHSVVLADACGRLLLEPSGTVDLRGVRGRCTVSVGRPLDEVISIKVEAGSLNCSLQSNQV